MPAAMAGYARRTGQAVPATAGEYVRAALECLALGHRQTMSALEGILGRPVIAGPAEATATGNILVQAMALGEVEGLSEARRIVRRSFALHPYEPGNTGIWDDAHAKLQKLSGH